MSSQEVHKFKLVGTNAGKDVRLGANGQYVFKKGICTIECGLEDAKRHQHILGKFYSAKRVRSNAEIGTVDDEVEDTESESAPAKKTAAK